MKKENLFLVFWDYIKQYKLVLILFALSLCICSAIFWLYNSPLEPVFYSLGLCFAIFAVTAIVRFTHYLKKDRERKKILNDLMLASDYLPKAETPIERDYLEMAVRLKQALNDEITERDSVLRESIDYYTTWVHQIKTPISVMQMILQSEDTDEHRELSSQLFRIEQYVEMVLNYIRLGGSNDFVFKEYSLDPIIKQAVHKFAPQFIRKHIRLRYEGVNVKVITDEKWLSFMIEQLLSNAVKYTERGQVSIYVTEDKVLKIADTGIGIAKEDIPRIFEKGFTGYNGRADKKSTGLGLYLCRMTADRLSHKVGVESKIGEGSVFSIDLNRYDLKAE